MRKSRDAIIEQVGCPCWFARCFCLLRPIGGLGIRGDHRHLRRDRYGESLPEGNASSGSDLPSDLLSEYRFLWKDLGWKKEPIDQGVSGIRGRRISGYCCCGGRSQAGEKI